MNRAADIVLIQVLTFVELPPRFSHGHLITPDNSKAIVHKIADAHDPVGEAKSRSSSRQGPQWTEGATARTETPF